MHKTPESNITNLMLGNRVMIVGCAGSGKTTLAKKISGITNLPVIHLDKHYWEPGWGKPADYDWETSVVELCKQEHWVMDGNYSNTMSIRAKFASSIIFLDVPVWKCLLRVLGRRFKFFFNKSRDDLPKDCNERISLEFYKWIWGYPKRSRIRTLSLLTDVKCPVYHISSNKEASTFINLLCNQTNESTTFG